MTFPVSSLASLSDQDLLAAVKNAAEHERHATADLVASLMELDARRLYLREGGSSLFTYCTQILHLSEHAAYGRIEAARAARRFPVILDLFASGAITLTAVGLLSPHLTPENHATILEAARHKSKRDVEDLVTTLRPRPDVVATVRKLPEPKPRVTATEFPTKQTPRDDVSSSSVARTPPLKPVAETRPLAPDRYKVQFTVGRETYDKLRRAQDLLRHTIPNGDPAIIFDRAITLLIADVERTKLAVSRQPRQSRRTVHRNSRHIPAAVKRAVWARDGGRCAFVGTNGRRCTETGFLEFHHVVPFAVGGEPVSENVELRCRSHNGYEAEQYFGLGPPRVREEGVTYGWNR